MTIRISLQRKNMNSNHRYLTNPIGFFLNGAWILHFFSPTKPTINYSNWIILIDNSNMNPLKNGSNCTSRSKFLMIQFIFLGRNGGYLDRGRERGNTIWPNISDKSHYTSTQDASSSPGLRKGTFGTPIGIKWKKELNTIFHFEVET